MSQYYANVSQNCRIKKSDFDSGVKSFSIKDSIVFNLSTFYPNAPSEQDYTQPIFFPFAVINFRRNHINRCRAAPVKLLDALTTGCPNRIRPQRLLYRVLRSNAGYSES